MSGDEQPKLHALEHRSLSYISGPLLFVERVRGVGMGEVVTVTGPDGGTRTGQVVELAGDRAVVLVYEGSSGLDLERTAARFHGEGVQLGVGLELLGRVLDGSGRPRDGGPPPLPETLRDVNGPPMNPVAREQPAEFIQTGFSSIDGLNTLVRGQKLPIFTVFGLPANQLAARIAAQARVPDEGAAGEGFVVVFAAMGITHREASFFRKGFEESGALERTVLFLNLADDPSIERLLLPRAALTMAEFLAFEKGLHVLVILTDMTNYCEALREVGTAREEIPGRRGYPGYLYTDLASLYERAGRVRGRPGSVTQLLIVTMPDGDISHPIPDLTGYITEGQIVLSQELHKQGVFPPVDVLPSLSRLMNAGIGEGKTRADHRQVANQLYALYAQGRELRRLSAIIGEAALSVDDRKVLEFAATFERTFVHQGGEERSAERTLDLAWQQLRGFPASQLKRLSPELIRRHLPE